MLRIDDTQQGQVLSAYVTDALGTLLQLVTPNDQPRWLAEPDDWAAVKNQRAVRNVTQPIRFQGQWHDDESGLYYNRHRYYDPQQGRYISQDPIGLNGGTNLYGYVTNPTGMVDPLGLETIASNCNTNDGFLNQVSDTASDVWNGLKWRYNAVATGLSEDFSDGFTEGMVRFTGGRPEQSFFEQTMDSYSSSSIAIAFIGDPIKKGVGILTGGAMAKTYGGYTIGNYVIRGRAPHLGTHPGTIKLVTGTTIANSALVTASYEGGAATGSVIRTSANRFFRLFD
ncbi:RHS repeat-associated core domain-containing protein [Halomonas sp. AOP42-C1-46]|uniref:RHS repeat-associated core domain-containing protein n=3 Tax=unclassified Halomonas TaxID=2609666 RepID=UPI004034016E